MHGAFGGAAFPQKHAMLCICAFPQISLPTFYTTNAPAAGESLLAWLGGGDAAGLQDSIANGTMCMSDENIAQAFGFSFQDEATITWEAATKPLFTSG